MNKIPGLVFFFFIIAYQLRSQILPKEGALLNYRLIGISFPAAQNTNKYTIEIAAGNHNNDESFRKNILLSLDSKVTKIIAEVPSFGSQYTWRVIHTDVHSVVQKSKFHHFNTAFIPEVDTNSFRFRILKKAEKHKDAYVFLDAFKTLYDMGGHPIWYLPAVADIPVRDLRITKRGTITFLSSDTAFEINYNGDILWKTPNNGNVSGDSIEHYHHEFTRLNDGHYMVLGNEYISWPWQPPIDTPHKLIPDAGNRMKAGSTNADNMKVQFGTVIEYDKNGKVVWSWKSSKYFINSDIKYFISKMGTDSATNKFMNRKALDVHENAFFFDEKNKQLYIGFRNINRIIKIRYPEGEVINTYGEIYKPGITPVGNGLYCSQHALAISKNGHLLVFNNNACKQNEPPTIVMMRDLPSGKGSLEKIWEFQCPVENASPDEQIHFPYTAGGNVIELPDQSIFASVSAPYSEVFIVTRDKDILWSARAEKWNPAEKKWQAYPQYRASIIDTRKEMEAFIWSQQVNK